MEDRMQDMARALSDRIKARKKLVQLASQIVRQMPDPAQPAGVDDIGYSSCGITGVEYRCYAYAPYYNPDPPYCTGEMAFVCKEFACTADGTDFFCGETEDYSCHDSFSCSVYGFDNAHSCEAASGFFCDDEFHCHGEFTCKATGATSLPDGSYSMEDGKDVTPGDFLCGWPTGGKDDFDCNTDFGCESKDDFRCADTTDFGCGTGDPVDKFNCGTAGGPTQFQCDGDDFSCTPMETFGCAVEFQCQKSAPFDCIEYQCPINVLYSNLDF